MAFVIDIRDRRQITLPADLLKELSLSVGDKLAFQVSNQKLIAKPIKNQSLETLKALQKTFFKANISERDLQESGVNIRKKLTTDLYG